MPETAKNILIIDDEEIVHASIKRILTRLGYTVESAMTAQEGLELLRAHEYDAIITDLMMPEMNGVELLGRMQQEGLDTPSIMVTGYPTIKTAIQALRLGAVDYIPKPFTRQELLSPLSRALRKIKGPPTAPPLPGGEEVELGPEGARAPGIGSCFVLPKHSWAVYNQDGTFDVGIEQDFIEAIPEVERIEPPLENDLVEQGHAGLTLSCAGEVHSVFMPLSGRVIQINGPVMGNPKTLDSSAWVLRIVPSQLEEEIKSLTPCQARRP